jgi:hypothetical protein
MHLRSAFFTLLPVLVIGCPATGADDDDSVADDDDAAATEGTLAVSFRIEADWADVMDEPAVGPFWGSIYLSEEVTALGPNDDAVALGSIYVEIVDLTGPDLTSPVLFTTDPLPAEWVVILGFMDSDGNSIEDDRDPDQRDPVTLPNDNQFLVIAGEETPAEVLFGFLNL